MLDSGERQVASVVDGIREDHVKRYEFVAKRERNSTIIDAACGVGYGSWLLHKAGNQVFGVDIDHETIEFAKKNYPGPVYDEHDLGKPFAIDNIDIAVCFETIEHIENPKTLLKTFRESCKRLYASVPNETLHPWKKEYEFHHRHYTQQELINLLSSTGWKVDEWYRQLDDNVIEGTDGFTLIVVCSPCEIKEESVEIIQEESPGTVPETVSILGLGPSLDQFVDISKRAGGAREYCDEVWGINAIGDVIKCDRIFHMDDVRVQEIRAKAKPESNIANMLKWMKKHPGPIYTSRPHEDYPGLVGLPIEAMLNDLKFDYFNSTAAWAVGYAIYIGVKKIRLFGCDFTYANAHDAEKGRACLEFWLGMAAARGIVISLPKTTSLMDACESRADRFYGYDTVHIGFSYQGDDVKLDFTEKDPPTAEEIEDRYDHSKHPSSLVKT